MPSLPRIRTRRVGTPAGAPEAAARPQPAELADGGLTWIHLESPTQEEAQLLAERFGWHPLDVEDVMSRRQRPKVDVYADEPDGGYLFTVLHFPVYDKSVGRLNAGELDVFLGPDYLVTLPSVDLRPVSLLFRRAADSPEVRRTLFARGSGRLMYEVLDDLYDYCFPILDKIGFKLESIDEEIGEAGGEGAKELVRDIHRVKQEIISYRKIIKPQRPTLRQLERQVERFLPQDLELYFDDIVDASERIWDLLDNYKEVVEALEDTNESLISHQQNDILYVLTIFSVVMLPLTFLTGLFGTNVRFPGFDTTAGFFGTIGIYAVAIVGMLGFFRWKRWL
ncbi:MAG TPA: magnesium transporter CorA family protein [Gaiellaceae bacterium]|nr:magnesium transporter CorA family protein [Gaiellaceae bacterium]